MQNLLGAIVAAIIPQVIQNIIPQELSQNPQPQNPIIPNTAISAPLAQYCQHCGQPLHPQHNRAGNAHFSPLVAALSAELIKEIAPTPKRKPVAKKQAVKKTQQKQGGRK